MSCFVKYTDNIVLLHQDYSRPHGNTYGVLGRKLKQTEPLSDAIFREVLEETGIDLKVTHTDYLGRVFVRYPLSDHNPLLYLVKPMLNSLCS